ncbi:protein NO VEIN domain-containing protein [Oryzobacter sp. R7]|uniref:protein NO VEIN domain-containing protein n=1 Tax=Oryzobacter faecalis TaxID=3388656 RepID=UPI00398CC049
MSDTPLTNREVEDIAIRLVLAREHAAGRVAVDARSRGAVADIEGDLLIEVKAFGGAARGSDLWLETRQVQAALEQPSRFHLAIVELVRSGQPRIIDIHGGQLSALLERRREKHYFEVPFPTSVYDALVRDQIA